MTLIFAYPGRLDLKTGGYGYDRRLIASLEQQGWQVRLLPLGEGFPNPDADTLEAAEQTLSRLDDESLVLIDGLAFGVLDHWAEREGKRVKVVALVHHPLALETGLSAESASALRQSETRALHHARHIIVTSPMTAGELVSGFSIDAQNITIAVPGTDQVPSLTRDSRETPHVLSVGSLTPRKGHDVLIAALKQVEDLAWRATIVGSKDFDHETVLQLERQISALQLGDRITLAGAVENTAPYFTDADLFALASRYEGYGMVFAEALAHGLPVVACSAGAVPDVVPKEAGILVPVDDANSFGNALRDLLSDAEGRREMSGGAQQAGMRLQSWAKTGQVVSDQLEKLR